MSLNLYPPPTSIRQGKGHLATAGRRRLKLVGAVDERLTMAILRFAVDTALEMTHGGDRDQVLIVIERTKKAGKAGPTGYELVCAAGGITLSAASDTGIFHGLMSLRQILRQGEGHVPFFRISDRPDFANRGVMLDISRCKVPTMQTLFRLVDDFAALKFNQLQLYTEHTFAFTNHPLVWADASPMNAAEILALRQYCADRYIELVPNLNSFGHFERWLRHPEYHRFAECPDGFVHPMSGRKMEFGSTLKPDRQTLDLLSELYDEYLPLFTSRQFNVGGDEPWELGRGASRKRCEKVGSTGLYIDFMAKIRQLAAARGRTMMFWSDIVLREPASLRKLSRDLVALNWGYEGNHPFRKECAQVAQARIPFYVCPGTSSWNTLTGRTANLTANLANAARNGIAHDASGYLVTDWGDNGHHQYLPISYSGFLLAACHAWNHKGSKQVDIADGLNRLFFEDGGGTTGEILLQLGRVLELAPSKIRNATLFNRLLFWSMRDEPGVAREVSNVQLDACEQAFGSLRTDLAGIGALREPALVRAELENAIDLAVHGIHRLQYFRGRRKDLPALREELSIAIGRHEALWLARNRPGGLNESSGHLRNSLEALGQQVTGG